MKNKLWIYLTAMMALVYHQQANAQYYIDGQRRIRPAYTAETGDIDGSPFLFEKWDFGTATTTAGNTYNNLLLKYDVLDDIVIFAGKDNELMAFPEKIKVFTIGHNTFACGFPAVDTLGEKNYYQVLTEGKALLLKHYTKHIQKTANYGSAVPNLKFVTTENWYLFKDGKMIPVKPNYNSIINALNDKKEQVQTFANNNKAKGDAQMAMLVVYYNNLK